VFDIPLGADQPGVFVESGVIEQLQAMVEPDADWASIEARCTPGTSWRGWLGAPRLTGGKFGARKRRSVSLSVSA